MQARTAFRHAIARALIAQSSLVDGRVFIQRGVKLTHASLPCVCVYTKEERTKEKTNSSYLKQSLVIELVVYAKRAPDSIEPGQNLLGLPSQPAQYAKLARHLDDVCEEVESIALVVLNPMRPISEESEVFCISSIQEISTTITESDEGDLPHAMATIQIVVDYSKDIKSAIEACESKLMSFKILHSSCNPTDPLNNAVAIETFV
jgi:hypothetical protein